MPDAPALVEVGRVTRAHGIRGEVKVDGPADLLEALEEVTRVFVQPGGADPRAVTRIGDVAGFSAALRQCRMHQGAALLVLDGVPTRNDAEALRGARIHVFGEDLPAKPAFADAVTRHLASLVRRGVAATLADHLAHD